MKKLTMLLVLVLAGCGNSGSGNSGSGNSYSSDSTGKYNWDAARAQGYSEADIDAAKTYSSESFNNSSPKEQEDQMIYNTLKQMGYSESDARGAAAN